MSTKTEMAGDAVAIKEPIKPKPAAAELLEQAAQLIETTKGTHSEKHYRMLAEDVRRLAARLAE